MKTCITYLAISINIRCFFIDVRSVAVMAGMHTNSNIATMYESLLKQTRRVRSIKKLHAFTDSGLEEDEFTECLHRLADCKEAYENYYL